MCRAGKYLAVDSTDGYEDISWRRKYCQLNLMKGNKHIML